MARQQPKSGTPSTLGPATALIDAELKPVKNQIDALDWVRAHRLIQLLLLDPRSQIGNFIKGIVSNHFQTVEHLEALVEARTRRPDDPEADQILELKQRMSWSRLARYLSGKENRRVTENAARRRYERARKRKGRIGLYPPPSGSTD